MRQGIDLLAAVLLMPCLLIVLMQPVGAEITYLDQFGSGHLLGPWGIAIHPDTLDVYVTEYGTWPPGTHLNRVQRFDRDGNFLGNWTDGLSRPTGIDVDLDGNLHIANHYVHKMEVFTPAGVHLRTYGVLAVSHPGSISIGGDGTIYVAEGPDGIAVFGSDETFQSRIGHGVGEVFGADLGPDGNVYAADGSNYRILVYDDNGSYLRQFGQSILSIPWQVDFNANGEMYVTDANAVRKFTTEGVYIETVLNEGAHHIDVDVGLTGDVYVAIGDQNVVKRFFDSKAWVFGENHFAEAAVGHGELLGASQSLSIGKSLVVDGNTTIMTGGMLEVCGGACATGTFVQEADSTLLLEIGDAALDNALIGCSSLALFDGTLIVTLAEGFSPQLGDRLLLFDAPTFSGGFDTLVVPTLPGGLYLDAHTLTTDGTLLVVPEPATVSLLLVGGLLFARRRVTTRSIRNKGGRKHV